MDVTRPVRYREHDLNDAADVNGIIVGNQINGVEYHPVDAVGYVEKRSASDGLDASDVYLNGRTLRMVGTMYGATRANLYDRLRAFRAAMSPTSAFAESPGDLGFLPLEYEEATADEVAWPGGFIPLMMRARAMGTPRWVIDRDRVGGVDGRGFAADWEIFMQARDPRIYAQDEQITYFNNAGNTSSGAGTVTNRGEYPAPLNVLIFVPSTTANTRIVTFAIGGSEIEISVPGSTHDRIARYNGSEKYLTLEEQGVETLRMDLLTIPSGLDHPLIPAGTSSYTWECNNDSGGLVNINALSRFWFWEAWT